MRSVVYGLALCACLAIGVGCNRPEQRQAQEYESFLKSHLGVAEHDDTGTRAQADAGHPTARGTD